MDNKTKAIGGASIATVAFALFHIFHGIHSISKADEDQKQSDIFKTAPVYIIQTDPNGKRDSILLKDYLKKIDSAGKPNPVRNQLNKAQKVQESDTTMLNKDRKLTK